jgi:hypothetical protein
MIICDRIKNEGNCVNLDKAKCRNSCSRFNEYIGRIKQVRTDKNCTLDEAIKYMNSVNWEYANFYEETYSKMIFKK